MSLLSVERSESCLRQDDSNHLISKSCGLREARLEVLLYVLEAILVGCEVAEGDAVGPRLMQSHSVSLHDHC